MIVNLKYIKKRVALCLLLTIICLTGIFQNRAHAGRLILHEKLEGIPLAEYAPFLEDKTAAMTVEEVSRLPVSSFTAPGIKKINFGYSDSAYWFRVEAVNPMTAPVKWLIESGYPLLDYITVFIPYGEGYHTIEGGDRISFSYMPHGFHLFTAEIVTPPGNSTYFIRIKSEGSVIIKLSAWDFLSFVEHFTYSSIPLWIFFGIMIALCFYNFFIYTTSLDRAYLYLSGFILSIILVDLVHNGLARKYFWPDNPWLANYSHPLFMFMACITIIKFTQHFMNTHRNRRTVDAFLNILLAFNSISTIIILFSGYNFATVFSVIAW